jgi:hypothetical protein
MLVVVARVGAHTIPSLTVEAEFKADGGYELRANVDPRLFLSAKPSDLPPVPVEWYRDQSESQLAETRRRAGEYLAKALMPSFNGRAASGLAYDFIPMDGATNLPLDDQTKEVHLLGKCQSRVPEGGGDFQVALGKDALVSMILLNSLEGKPERRPQVLFPGEVSRPFKLALSVEKKAGENLSAPVTAAERKTVEPDFAMPVWVRIGIAACLFASLLFQFARRKG